MNWTGGYMENTLSKPQRSEALHTLLNHRDGAPRAGGPLPRLILFLVCFLLGAFAASGIAQTRWCELCYPAADTGLVKADFTLTYYSDTGTTATPVSSTALTVTQTALGTTGKACYRFYGLSNSNTLMHHLIAKVTSTGSVDGCRVPWSGAAQAVEWHAQIVISTPSLTFKRHDTGLPLQASTNPLFSADPTGSPTTATCRQVGSSTAKFTRQAATATGTLDSTTGLYSVSMTYLWGATDLNTAGTFNCEFELTYAGTRLTLPPGRPLQIQVVPNIAGP